MTMTVILSQKSAKFLAIVLLGLALFSSSSDARAVNVSNAWTMPQEGLNVFYRFFRDRISWFEADAVCQFHHANLVTVDNSFQFDATRDLLRELDVNDIVWIGLMRPQNGERFMWSNSRPLIADTGYWAESLPLMDAPLCAVIDPIRDYRWHALRCGGPETASFLCEMPVPSWADACILRDMPNLTMQYMADTASVELIRNCEEEGLIRQTCKSKQDRERILRELVCQRERMEAQRINDITNSHFKSLQIINSIRTDNNENNDIELLPLGSVGSVGHSFESNRDFNEEAQTEKNTVQRLIEQFNVDELMQADEPAMMNNENGFIIPGQIPKPVKKTSKKVIINGNYTPLKKEKFQKYASQQQQQQQQQMKKQQQQQQQQQQEQKPEHFIPLEDMMMGDQPMQHSAGEPELPESHTIDDDVTNEIMEPLPHKKKILPQDLRTMPSITERSNVEDIAATATKATKHMQPSTSTAAATSTTTTTTTTTTATTTTTDATTTTTTAAHVNTVPSVIKSTKSPDAATVSTATTQHPAAIEHPMHPQQTQKQQQHSNANIETDELQQKLHVKESIDNSHFIPPLLMVKSHYVPPGKHGDHLGHEHQQQQQHLHEHVDNLKATSDAAAAATANGEIIGKVDDEETPKKMAKIIENPKVRVNSEQNDMKKPGSNATSPITKTSVASTINKPTELLTPNVEQKQKEITKSNAENSATTDNLATIKATEATTATVNIAQASQETTERVVEIKTSTSDGAAAADDKQEISSRAPQMLTTTATLATSKPITATTKIPMTRATAATTTTTATTITTTTAASSALPNFSTSPMSTTTAAATNPITVTANAGKVTTLAATSTTPTMSIMTTTAGAAAAAEVPTTTDTPALSSTHNFLKEADAETPFKPNRRRSLTKPETASYFKKILG